MKLRAGASIYFSPRLGKAERLSRLCGAGAPFRPFFLPRSFVLCSGAEDLPNATTHDKGQSPQCNRKSIGKSKHRVNSKSCGNSEDSTGCGPFRGATPKSRMPPLRRPATMSQCDFHLPCFRSRVEAALLSAFAQPKPHNINDLRLIPRFRPNPASPGLDRHNLSPPRNWLTPRPLRVPAPALH